MNKTDKIFIIFLIMMSIPYFYISLSSPIIFGDEGYHIGAAKIMASGTIPKYAVLTGSDAYNVGYIYPPLYSLIMAVAYLIGGLGFIKLMIPVFTILTSIVIYLFLRKISMQREGLIASLIFLAVPNTVLYGTLAYTDSLLALFLTLFLYFMHLSFESKGLKCFAFCGLFAGLAMLTKGIGAISIPIFILAFLFRKSKDFKGLSVFLLISLALLSIWIVRNYSVFDAFCYDPILSPKCEYAFSKTVPPSEFNFTSRAGSASTEASPLQMGILPFSDFAFGLPVMFLFFLGVPFLFQNKLKPEILSFIIFFLILFLIYSFGLGYLLRSAQVTRAEDMGRYLLGIVPAMSIVIGIFLVSLNDYLKSFSFRKIAMVFIILLTAYLLLNPYYGKLQVSYQIKQFPQSWFDACNWVQRNTPKDILLYTPYATQVGFTCERRASVAYPDNADVQLSGNGTTYNLLKLHGYDYIFIPVNQISNQNISEAFSTVFYNYMTKSSNFKLVYSNTDKYGNNGVEIYEVL
jgi:4-amino-4-deoxy-L-arabinose transferase-like glycosyltransferase